MTTVEEIQAAVRHLTEEELATFRAWFAEFDAAHWDSQIGRDVEQGRLDLPANEAIEDLHQGRCTEL